MRPHVLALVVSPGLHLLLESGYVRVQLGQVLLDHLGQLLDISSGVPEKTATFGHCHERNEEIKKMRG